MAGRAADHRVQRRRDHFSQYDLRADPVESRPQPASDELRRALVAYTRAAQGALDTRARSGESAPPALPPDATRQLEELGYLE